MKDKILSHKLNITNGAISIVYIIQCQYLVSCKKWSGFRLNYFNNANIVEQTWPSFAVLLNFF